ncbi:MAG: hypothetical protein ACRDWW_10200, partial [Acidimicrobiales bacterium]
MSGVGLLGLFLAAWGGISVFVGPLFGFDPTTSSAWDWTTQNWLLHLIPGACGVFAGLVILGSAPGRRVGRSGGGSVGMAALLMLGAGIWFVIGPAVWPLFESSSAYAHGASTNMTFLNQLGANLGPGVLLAALSGMALKAGIARPRVAVEEPLAAGARGAAVGEAVPARRVGRRERRRAEREARHESAAAAPAAAPNAVAA